MVLILVGCNNNEEIIFHKTKYKYIDFVDLNLREGQINKYGKKIGKIYSSDVYKINGLDSKKIVYCDLTQGMSDGEPFGVYASKDIKLRNLKDFKPSRLKIYYYPLSTEKERERLIYTTNDLKIVKKIEHSIEKGTPISDKKMNKIKIKIEYTIEFESSLYPHLLVSEGYIEGKNHKYYTDYNGRYYKIDKTISNYILNP